MPEGKPNILVIWGDDIGITNLSCYSDGLMGYRTPNIDRIAQEGMRFTDSYGEQSCTAGRSSFITGQSVYRTGLSKVGMPGVDVGLSAEDPTIAELLKPLGYATGQFGKNHLGDLNKHLPTAHGFDEFFGNLYHLNAEEEPENPDYPQNPEFRERFGPRGVIRSSADGEIEDTGPLTRKRMETVDEETTAAALDFMQRAHDEGKPFFVWWNSTRMHIFTHLPAAWEGKTGYGIYADGMAQHDADVGQLLDKLDELGIAENTIVMYSTDNGAETFTWPDGGTTMFRGEKATQWEGGFRVPAMIRWPGVIEPGTVINAMAAFALSKYRFRGRTTFTVLMHSSDESMQIDRMRVAMPPPDPPGMLDDYVSGGEPLTIAARVSGPVKTAYPDGPPKDAAAEGEEDAASGPPAGHLAEGTLQAIVVSDADLLEDKWWVQVQNFFGNRIGIPSANNADFVVNCLDNLSGSEDLIGLRSRGKFNRPFDRVTEIRRAAEARYRAEEEELEAKLRETEAEISKLQSQQDSATGSLILGPEERAAIEKFRDERVETRKKLRDVKHELRKEIESLGTWLKALNIGIYPAAIGVLAFAVGALRHRRRS